MKKVLMFANDNYLVDRRILQQAKAIRQAGYQVQVISGFEAPVTAKEIHDGVEVQRYAFEWGASPMAQFLIRKRWTSRPRLAAALIRAEQIFNRIAGRFSEFERQVLNHILSHEFDILHVHDMPMLRVGVEAARRRNAKLVYDAHELYFAQSTIPPKTRLRLKHEERKYIHRPDLVYTVNPLIAKEMSRLYGRKDIQVLLNSAPTSDDKDNTLDLRQLANVGPERKIVLYQGWLSPERGINHLIDVAVHFGDRAQLVVVGYGANLDMLKEQARKLGIEQNVSFLGRIENDVLRRLTHQADIGVIPYIPCDFNTLNCSPNKLFEFIGAGIPVVANDLPFIRSFIEEFDIGAVANIQNAPEFASKVVSVLERLKVDSKIKDNCLRAQREKGWEAEQTKLLSWYDSLQCI